MMPISWCITINVVSVHVQFVFIGPDLSVLDLQALSGLGIYGETNSISCFQWEHAKSSPRSVVHGCNALKDPRPQTMSATS